MKTILMTAYAVNPFKGSEDGMGWHYVLQAARQNRIIAVTRRNNRPHIERYMEEHPLEQYRNIWFLYFDWPQYMLFWKKGPLLSMVYYYCWQLSLVVWLRQLQLRVDVVHNLNFHNDWTPSFLWLLHRNFVWGPVGHHPRIPAAFIRPYGTAAYVKDRLLWLMKCGFWRLDPLLYLTKKRARQTWCMHPDAAGRLHLKADFFIHPSIAAPAVQHSRDTDGSFHVLSIGRFVPLKGFDVTIRAFAVFLRKLDATQRSGIRLTLIGKGPCKVMLQQMIQEEGLEDWITWCDWMPQEALQTAYHSASVFLYPSHEGAGMVVAEAMGYGIPVVCWDNPGPGTIVHPRSDLKVPYGSYRQSIQAFADKLYQLFTDRAYYETERLRATVRFDTALDWNLKAGQLNDMYTRASRHF